ncbi:MAG: ASPIC/UnbV domain-containing protein [Bacteroidia bacterium]|nr:ASPIC/UnbV domain-containing protein [Bacteroidia bacterium]
MDVFISHVDKQSTSAVLRNEGGNSNHWLGLTLKGKIGPASAISAKVIVTAGSSRQVLINQWGTSYLSANDPRLHIGLGQNKKIKKLEIHWMDGTMETYDNIEADRYITIQQGKGIVIGNQ